MKRLLFILPAILFFSVAYSQPQTESTENFSIIDEINDDSWMDKYFLIKRFNFLPVIRDYRDELGLTDEQLKIINQFYKKYYKKMVDIAKKIQEEEKKLENMILNGGSPEKIKKLVVDIAKLKAELTVYNIKEVRTLQSAMTKEQFKKLLDLSGQDMI